MRSLIPCCLLKRVAYVATASFFYMDYPTDRTAHTTAFIGPVVDHWLERKIAQTGNASAMQDRSAMQEDLNLYSQVLYRLSYFPPLGVMK